MQFNPLKPAGHGPFGFLPNPLRISKGRQAGIGLHPLLDLPSQQFYNRNLKSFSSQIPKCQIDAADGAAKNPFDAIPVGIVNHLLKPGFYLPGVFSDQQWFQNIVDRADHGQHLAVRRELFPAFRAR